MRIKQMSDNQKYGLHKEALAKFQEQDRPHWLLKQEASTEEVDE